MQDCSDLPLLKDLADAPKYTMVDFHVATLLGMTYINVLYRFANLYIST